MKVREPRWSLRIAVASIAAGAALHSVACDDRTAPDIAGADAASEPAPLDPAVLACFDAGGTCLAVTGAKNAFGCNGLDDIGPCGDLAECCKPYNLSCGNIPCGNGNTCDSNVLGYCSGATNTPNCGSVACLGYCTCTADQRCDCPQCQLSPEQSGPAGPGCLNGVLYECSEYADDVKTPGEAGVCDAQVIAYEPTGNLCCGL